MFWIIGPREIIDEEIPVYGNISTGSKGTIWETHKCPKCGRITFIRQVNELPIELYGSALEDFVWLDDPSLVVAKELRELLAGSGLIGFGFRSIEVIDWHKDDGETAKQENVFPDLYQMVITGKGELLVDSQKGPTVEVCDQCRIPLVTELPDPLILDSTKWDGSDFFITSEFPGYVFLTDSAVDFLKTKGARGFEVTPVSHSAPDQE